MNPLKIVYHSDSRPVGHIVRFVIFLEHEWYMPGTLCDQHGNILLMGRAFEGRHAFLLRALAYADEKGFVFERDTRFEEEYPDQSDRWVKVSVPTYFANYPGDTMELDATPALHYISSIRSTSLITLEKDNQGIYSVNVFRPDDLSDIQEFAREQEARTHLFVAMKQEAIRCYL